MLGNMDHKMDTRIAVHAKLTQKTHVTKCWSAKGPKGD
jgi:hypothetical protein